MLNFEDVKSGDILYNITPEKTLIKLYVKNISIVKHPIDKSKIHGINIFVSKEYNEFSTYRIFIHNSYFDKNVKFTQIIDTKYKEIEDIPDNTYQLISTNKNDLIDYHLQRLQEIIEYQQRIVNEGLKTIEKIKDEKEKFKIMKDEA